MILIGIEVTYAPSPTPGVIRCGLRPGQRYRVVDFGGGFVVLASRSGVPYRVLESECKIT